MSGGKHTPGPWTVAGPSGDLEIWSREAHKSIAFLASYPDPANEAANARLIAAAPELLEALEGLMEWREEIRADLRLHTSPDALLAKAHAAIAKARGEQ